MHRIFNHNVSVFLRPALQQSSMKSHTFQIVWEQTQLGDKNSLSSLFVSLSLFSLFFVCWLTSCSGHKHSDAQFFWCDDSSLHQCSSRRRKGKQRNHENDEQNHCVQLAAAAHTLQHSCPRERSQEGILFLKKTKKKKKKKKKNEKKRNTYTSAKWKIRKRRCISQNETTHLQTGFEVATGYHRMWLLVLVLFDLVLWVCCLFLCACFNEVFLCRSVWDSGLQVCRS